MTEEYENPNPKNENLDTASGESLDEVLSTIRETVSAHVEAPSPSLASALNDLRSEVSGLQKRIETNRGGQASMDSKTIEDIISKLVKPMLEIILKDWVEKNLFRLAEQIIREEIEKIYRER